MDAWSPDQLKRMQLGGNDKLNEFLVKWGTAKETSIKEKYNSPGAEVGVLYLLSEACSHLKPMNEVPENNEANF